MCVLYMHLVGHMLKDVHLNPPAAKTHTVRSVRFHSKNAIVAQVHVHVVVDLRQSYARSLL